ncbi:MAG: hypothetical protein KF680_05150 [Cryobacterium sp.]|nr:hypothetical protein [Cryobacterium sp.]
MAIDYNPLFEDVSKADLQIFRRQEKSAGGGAITIVIGVAAFALLAYFTISMLFSELLGESRPERIAVIVGVASAVGVGGFFALRAIAQSAARRRYRITKFATRNGMLYSTTVSTPQYPGAIFEVGRSRQVYERLWRHDAPPLDIGNYRYTTGSGKNKQTHLWSFLGLRLPRRLPHMLLDAKGNNSLFGSNLPVSFNKNQRLSLEGDFDRHFTLYCPREYESDALYIFTPDLMALLIDEAAKLDVEIVDDWMFVYSRSKLDLANPHALAPLFNIVDTVGRKTSKRSERYADDRVLGSQIASDVAPLALDGSPQQSFDASTNGIAPRLSHNQIAPRGLRLKQQTPWLFFGITAAIVVLWFAARFITGAG